MRHDDAGKFAAEFEAALEGKPSRADARALALGFRALPFQAPDALVQAALAVFPPPQRSQPAFRIRPVQLEGARGGADSRHMVLEAEGAQLRLLYDPSPEALYIVGRIDREGWWLDAAGETFPLTPGEAFEVALKPGDGPAVAWCADAEIVLPTLAELDSAGA